MVHAPHACSALAACFLVINISLLAGCSNQSATSTADPPATRLAPADAPGDDTGDSAVAAVTDITDAEAREFAAKWQAAVVSADFTTAKALIDWTGIFERATSGLVSDGEFKTGFMSGAAPAVDNLVQTIAASIQGTGSYEFVDVATRGGEPHVVFRLFADNGGLNYHDLKLRRDGGRIVGDELFIAATGEAFSDTLRGLVSGVLKSQQSLTGRLSGQAQREMERLELQSEISQAMREGDPARALQLYEALPDDMKKQKMPMLTRIMATPVEDELAYRTAVDEYITQFPEDASVGLISIDAAVMSEDMDMLVKAHTALTAWTGGDSLLDLMVAANMANFGEVEKATQMIADVDVDGSTNPMAHQFRLTLAMAAKDHPESLKRLRILRDTHGFEFSDLREVEEFKAFVESPEFEQWQAD